MDKQYCCYYLVFLTGLLSCYVEASHWPEGSYGLPMAKSGCPAGATFKWETGWIYQDTENDHPQSSKSKSFHIEGQVKSSSVNRSFCIKTDTTGDVSQIPDWPSGTYCIYQKTRDCPTSFTRGSVRWDDEDDNNGDHHKGTVPRTGNSGQPTTLRIFFCCRRDRQKAIPIDLPTASPFYLLAHLSEKCQQVRWAVATPEWIYYDTEDDDHYGSDVKNPAPYIPPKKETALKVYYCYYKSCQYSLNTSTGSIKSPSFPANYPSGQQCSWNISAEANKTIFVRFVNFSLNDINDFLMFHDGTSDASPDIMTLDGTSTSSEIAGGVRSSSSNLFVVFHSNEVGSSSGFKAMYSTTDSDVTVSTTTSSTTAEERSTTRAAEETTTQSLTRITTKTTTEKTNPKESTPSSGTSSSKSSSEPSSPPKGNSSKNYDKFKKTCVQKNQSALIAVSIVIPLICMIAVIAMAAYLFRRLRNLREKPSDVSVRYITNATSGPESMSNPTYLPSDAVIEKRSPNTNNANDAHDAHEESNGDIYHEIEPNSDRQATDNPLYQSTDDDKHVYASFA